MDRMPPPAPARAWATLSFWGMTGLDCDMLNNFVVVCLVMLLVDVRGRGCRGNNGQTDVSSQVEEGKEAIAEFKLFYRERGKKR